MRKHLFLLFLLLFSVAAYSQSSFSLFHSNSVSSPTCGNSGVSFGASRCTASLSDSSIIVCVVWGTNDNDRCRTFPNPAGSSSLVSVVSYSITASSDATNGCASSCSAGSYSCVGPGYSGCTTSPCNGRTLTSSCLVTFSSNSQSLPSCSDFLSVPAGACKGGTGLWCSGSSCFDLPNFNQNNLGVFYNSIPPTLLFRPNGSFCETSGFENCGPDDGCYIGEAIYCPLGFSDENSSSSSESSSSSSEADQSSSSSSDDDSSSSSNGLPDICEDFPDLPGCGDSSGSSGSGDGGDGDCVNLHDCNWARIDIQLIELGVAVETRDAVRDLANLTHDIKDLNYQQVNAIYDVRDALSGVSGGIAGLGGSLDSILGLLRGGNGSGSGNGNLSGTISDGVADGLVKWGSDTSGTGAFNDSLSSWGEGGFGGPGSQMVDSLGNGLAYRQKIKSAVGIDSTSFAFLGNSSSCPVIDISFDSGLYGIKNDKNIDLCDIEGYNVGQTLRSVLWLSVLCFCLFMDLRILRAGGRA